MADIISTYRSAHDILGTTKEGMLSYLEWYLKSYPVEVYKEPHFDELPDNGVKKFIKSEALYLLEAEEALKTAYLEFVKSSTK